MNHAHDRLIWSGILLALILALALPQALFAGAEVQNGFACTVNALDTGLPEPLTSTDTHSIVTPQGNSVLVCKFQGPADNIYESAYQNRGFLCGTFAGTTYNSKIVVTPSGQVIFTCHVHPNKQNQSPTDPLSATSDQPVDTPSEASSENGNGNGQGNGNGNSAQQSSEDPAVTSEDETTTTPEDSGPGNSGNHGNGNGQGNGNGNNTSSGGGNGNSGGNGNGNGNGHGNDGGE